MAALLAIPRGLLPWALVGFLVALPRRLRRLVRDRVVLRDRREPGRRRPLLRRRQPGRDGAADRLARGRGPARTPRDPPRPRTRARHRRLEQGGRGRRRDRRPAGGIRRAVLTDVRRAVDVAARGRRRRRRRAARRSPGRARCRERRIEPRHPRVQEGPGLARRGSRRAGCTSPSRASARAPPRRRSSRSRSSR